MKKTTRSPKRLSPRWEQILKKPLQVSRGVRWDSDHVTLLNDDLLDLARESIRNDNGSNLFYTLDYFDASINRLAAWVIGARNWQKALLQALLEPDCGLCQAEYDGDFTARMAIRESFKSLPWGAVWNYYCARQNLPSDMEVLAIIRNYEHKVLANRQ